MLTRLASDPPVIALLDVFERVRTRLELGGHRFPTTSDILITSQSLIAAGAEFSDVVVAAQQDWFRRGQTGCVFARIAALKHTDGAWPYLVVDNETTPEYLDSRVTELCDGDGIQVASIVFPQCSSLSDFVKVVGELVHTTTFWCEGLKVLGTSAILKIRRPISPGVEAWVMAFGPDPSLPATRRAPFYELALRVKSKRGDEYRRLNQDPSVAHLADFPLTMPPRHWDDRWDTTKRRTAAILGHVPDEVSAARSTLTVPVELLDKFGHVPHSVPQT